MFSLTTLLAYVAAADGEKVVSAERVSEPEGEEGGDEPGETVAE